MSVVTRGDVQWKVKGQDKVLTQAEYDNLKSTFEGMGLTLDAEQVSGTVSVALNVELDANASRRWDKICADAGLTGDDKDANMEKALLFLVTRYRSSNGGAEGETEKFSVGDLTATQIDSAVRDGAISEEIGDKVKAGATKIGPRNINALKDWLAKQNATPAEG